MKRFGLFWLCFVLLLCAAPLTVSADTGPKPSVVVNFTGASEETYYVTLLSETDSTGPWWVYDGTNKKEWMIEEAGDEEAFQKFVAYSDPDGYYFLQYFKKLSGNAAFTWGYHPPQRFKILVYFPGNDTFAVSEVHERYAFDSYFDVDLQKSLTMVITTPSTTTATDDTATTSTVITPLLTTTAPATLTVTRNYDYAAELISFAARMVFTVAIELAIAWLFRFRQKRQMLVLLAVNAATQLLLNGALNVLWHQMGQQWSFWMWYLLLEVGVFAVEAALYSRLLRAEGERRHPVWYALAANAASFAAGLLLARWIPWLF